MPPNCITPAPPVCSASANVLLVIDTSNDMRQVDFNTMLSFLAHDLVTQWPLDKFGVWVTASPNEVNNQVTSGFSSYSLRSLQDTIQVSTIRDASKPPTIEHALSFTAIMLSAKGPSNIILISSSSNKTDLQNAVTASSELKKKGHTLITLGLGTTVDNADLGNLATPNAAFSSKSFAAGAGVAKKITEAICSAHTTTTTPLGTTPTPISTSTPISTPTPTPTAPPCQLAPCSQKLLVVVDASADISSQNFARQQQFITSTLIDPSWTNFDQYLYGYYDDLTDLGLEGMARTRAEAVGLVSHTYQSNDPPSLKILMNSMVVKFHPVIYDGMVTIIFSGSQNKTDITAAYDQFKRLRHFTNIVIVAFPGADPSLSTIANTLVSWSNPGDSNGFGALNSQIVNAGKLNCTCQGTPTPTPSIGTTTTPGSVTTPATTTPSVGPTTPAVPSCAPCNHKLIVIVDASADVSPANFAYQQQYVTSTLIDPSWTNFDQYAYTYYDNMAQMEQFGSIRNRNEAIGLVSHTVQSKDYSSLRTLMSAMFNNYAIVPHHNTTAIIFSGSQNRTDIAAAHEFFTKLEYYMNIVIVALPGADQSLSTISNTIVSWSNPSNSNGYGALNSQIMTATNLNCNCHATPTPSIGTTTSPGSVTTPSAGTTAPPVTGTTPPAPSCAPCNQKLAIIVDASADISSSNFARQQNFIITTLIDPSWKNFDQYSYGYYDDLTEIEAFGVARNRKEAVGLVANTYQSKDHSSLRLLMSAMFAEYNFPDHVRMTAIIFSGSQNKTDIAAAHGFFTKLEHYMNIVIVALPGADQSLSTISNTLISWSNPSNSNGYGALNSQIMAATHLNCNCQATPTPSIGTTTSPGGATSTPSGEVTTAPTTTTTPSLQTTTPTGPTCAPCTQKLAIIADASSDITTANFALQQQFITSTLISQSWTNFDQFSYAYYDDNAIIATFGTIRNRNEAVGLVQHTYQSKDYSSLTTLYRTIRQDYDSQVTVVIFSGSQNTSDIRSAQKTFTNLHGAGVRIVIVALPGAATSLATMANVIVPWTNPADTNAFGALSSQIMAATKLTCNCNGGTTGTTTPSGVTTTPQSSTTPATVTPTNPAGCAPCNGKLSIIVDASADISATDFTNQQKFVTSTLISPSWTDFDQYSYGHYDDMTEIEQFGSILKRQEAVGLVQNTFQSQKYSSIQTLIRSMADYYKNQKSVAILFSGSKNDSDIAAAQNAYLMLRTYVKVIVVGLPGASPKLSTISSGAVLWNNTADANGYGALTSEIMRMTKLNCSCGGGATVTPGGSTTTTPQAQTTTPSGTTTTPAVATTTSPSTTTTPSTPGCAPCSKKLLVVVDKSSDISAANYALEQNFITSTLIDPSWTDFNQFALASYDDNTNILDFGTFKSRSGVVGAVTHTYHSVAYSNIRKAMETLAMQYSGGDQMAIVFFTGSTRSSDITAALPFYTKLGSNVTVVMVALPGSDTSDLKRISSSLISWANPGDSNGYGALNAQIMAATKLNCTCSGGATPTQVVPTTTISSGTTAPSVTTTTPATVGTTTTPVAPTVTPTNPAGCAPCNGKLSIIVDASADISATDFTNQQKFVTSTLISPSWTDFDQYSYGHYDDMTEIEQFGSILKRQEAVGLVQNTFQSQKYSSIQTLIRSMADYYKNQKSVAILFSGSKNDSDIAAAQNAYLMLRTYVKVIVVGLPGASPKLSTISSGAVLWNNTADANGYGALTSEIMRMTKLNCSCGGGATVTPGGSTTTTPQAQTTTTPSGTTTTPAVATTTSPSTTTTASTPGCAPCSKKLLVVVDKSSDISAANYALEQNFITSTLIDPSWTDFNQFALASYDDNTNILDFGTFKSRAGVVGAVTHTYHSIAYSNIRKLMETLAIQYSGGDQMATVIFTGSNRVADITAAKSFYAQISNTTTVVMVALPGADTADLKSISSSLISWANPGDSNGYGALNGQIMAATKLNCKCNGGATTVQPATTKKASTTSGVPTTTTQSQTTASASTTTSSQPPKTTTTTQPAQTTTSTQPPITTTASGSCAPCNGKLAVIVDTSNDNSESVFNAQRSFVENQLISPSWSNFQQFSIGHYDSTTLINGFGTVTNRNSITGYLNFVCKYQKTSAPSLTSLYKSIQNQYGSDVASVVIFSSSTDKNDILSAQKIYSSIKSTMTVVIVASGSYDATLQNIASVVVPWSSDANALNSQILAATKLNCNCGGATNPPSQTTVVPTSPPPQMPYKGEIVIMMDASSDVSMEQFDDERSFLSNDFVTSDWTDFSRFAVGSYADTANNFELFGSFRSWKEVIASIVHQPRVDKKGNIRVALQTVQEALKNANPTTPRVTILFTNTADENEIRDAAAISEAIRDVTKIVVVALKGTDSMIGNLEATVIHWDDPDNVANYGSLKQAILQASGLPYTGPSTSPPQTTPSNTIAPPTLNPELPCAGQLFVVFDASADLTSQAYLDQTNFLTQTFFSPDWTRYDRFALSSYANLMNNFDSFGSIKGRSDLVAFIQDQIPATTMGNIRIATEWLASTLASSTHGIDSSTATIVLFTNTAKQKDIQAAKPFMQKVQKYATVVLVTLPNTDDSINTLLPESNVLPWPKPDDAAGYVSLKKRILQVSGLKCA
ncbi:hypothetical protein QR680_018213 [Steinernema hermaphroditum]|uniref:VWFA domain-containing protein n=1 Tax=Steinernema hermaphroditum TaxID=289476 RepID=A0AA39LQD0_9BILA|nr:hypothetical protein QR680_018213 [Steinernema hermaphroditum]